MIELLVAIAVMLVLSSLAIPVLGRAQHYARAVPCISNLRQWGLAVQMYAQDHDDFLPPEGFPNPTDRHTNSGWYIQLPSELALPRYHAMPWRTNASVAPGSTAWLCPANRRRSNGRNLFHYCLNEQLDGTGSEEVPARLVAIPQPAHAIVLFDSKNLPAVGHASYVHTNLHRAGAHFLFLDGHVRRFPREQYWDTSANRPRTNHAELTWRP